VIDLRSLPML